MATTMSDLSQYITTCDTLLRSVLLYNKKRERRPIAPITTGKHTSLHLALHRYTSPNIARSTPYMHYFELPCPTPYTFVLPVATLHPPKGLPLNPPFGGCGPPLPPPRLVPSPQHNATPNATVGTHSTAKGRVSRRTFTQPVLQW